MATRLSGSRYICFCVVSLLTMLAGAQTIHNIYRPLDNLEDLVEETIKQKQAQK